MVIMGFIIIIGCHWFKMVATNYRRYLKVGWILLTAAYLLDKLWHIAYHGGIIPLTAVSYNYVYIQTS